jgi:hypothetical protein
MIYLREAPFVKMEGSPAGRNSRDVKPSPHGDVKRASFPGNNFRAPQEFSPNRQERKRAAFSGQTY